MKRRLALVSPAPLGSTLGNSVTAQRYAGIFRSLGWRVVNEAAEPADFMVALHARKSARAALAFRREFPDGRLIVVLTGTDLYRDIRTSRLAQRALQAADALVTLQPDGLSFLPAALRRKAVAIVQSAPRCAPARARSRRDPFRVCVLGHLRYEKDPLRAAQAVRALPKSMAIEVVQAGEILDSRYEKRVRDEERRNPRYRYAGALSRAAARRLLCSSTLTVLSSRMEGGANVLCEAIACGVPVLASRISGNVGIVSRDYPGLYRCGDTQALARLIARAATDSAYYASLRQRCIELQPLVSYERERQSWRALLRP